MNGGLEAEFRNERGFLAPRGALNYNTMVVFPRLSEYINLRSTSEVLPT